MPPHFPYSQCILHEANGTTTNHAIPSGYTPTGAPRFNLGDHLTGGQIVGITFTMLILLIFAIIGALVIKKRRAKYKNRVATRGHDWENDGEDIRLHERLPRYEEVVDETVHPKR
jgi:hypothetical protein